VNDRRLLLGLALIMVIAFLPTYLMKKKLPPKAAITAVQHDSLRGDSGARVTAPADSSAATVTKAAAAPTGPAVHEDTVIVRSPLYRYAVSTRGGRIISSRFLPYVSLNAAHHRDTLELIPPGTGLLASTLVAGTDTLHLDQISFTASADSLSATTAPATLTLHGESAGHTIDLTYQFSPTDYRITASGTISGVGPNGGTLLIGLGNGFLDTESDSVDNARQSGIVTKLDKTTLLHFSSLKPRIVTPISGPFEWAAVKSKYFVAGLFSYDSTTEGVRGRIGGVEAFAADTQSHPIRANVIASISVPSAGTFGWSLYLGPMEYDRLSHMGHQFDDVNPYGWAWFRPLIRPIAVVIRSIFVWMHTAMGLGYGLVIVIFGLVVRILIWPLSRIAMRSMARMQAIQPLITELQARYKDDPAQLQKETFKLYKEHNVNPFGGCWPMLLPYPLLVAVFFVLAYTIEVRGQTFLWLPDLARADPLYIIPILMGASMFAVSKIGQMGLPPNPQTKMMTWLMPVVMLVFFAKFASGLNLYYTIQNLASIPQQWLVMKERQKMMPIPIAAAPVVKRKS
jgi:YidC/Oxa1 family membrane protein insertase